MLRLIGQFILNGLGLLAASAFIPGVELTISLENIALIAAALTLVNLVLKPLLKLILTPFVIVTLGLFLIVINMGLLWLVDWIFNGLTFTTLVSLFWTTLGLTILNFLLIRKSKTKKVVIEKVIERRPYEQD